MPLNTRVGHCVTKLRNRYGYGKAIGICQKSTKQNYMTGKSIRHKKRKTRKRKMRKKRGGINEPNQSIFWIIQNNEENINNFQEQSFSPDADAEDAEGFDNLMALLHNPFLLLEGGFWIVEYSLTRELDDNYHHYHLAWENDMPNINDNPDLVNAIQFINGEIPQQVQAGGAGEPNDGLIYARDFVNVAQEPEDGWANWQWNPNTNPPPLKVPIGSKYLLYTYNGNDDNNPEIDIVELVSNMVSPFNNDGELMIMFANIENDDGWPFESDDWNKEDGGAPTIGTHQDAYDGDIRGDYPMYVIEHFVGKQQRISDLPKKPTPKPPKSHQGWPLKIPEPKSKLPYMTQPEIKTAVAVAAGGRRKKTRKAKKNKKKRKRTHRRKSRTHRRK